MDGRKTTWLRICGCGNLFFPSWKHTNFSTSLRLKELFREEERKKRVKARQTGDGFSPFSTLFFLIPFTRFGRFQSSRSLSSFEILFSLLPHRARIYFNLFSSSLVLSLNWCANTTRRRVSCLVNWKNLLSFQRIFTYFI